MRLDELTVECRDINLKRIGLVPPELLNMSATLAHNDVGEWTINLPTEHPMAQKLRTPGNGLIVQGPSDVLFSGPTTSVTYEGSSIDPRGMVAITGATDNILLADRLAFPQPSNPNAATQNRYADKHSGKAESVMLGFVNLNIGPAAPAGRREPRLILAPDKGRGPQVTKTARFIPLGPMLADLATNQLGFRVVQRGSNLVFETYAVRDLSKLVRLTLETDSLESQRVVLQAPTATRAIIGGNGEDDTRAFFVASAQAVAEEVWGRKIERFIDQSQTDDTDEYTTAALELYAAEGQTFNIAATGVPGESTTMRFGKDWGLGDRIAMTIAGDDYAAVATTAVLKVDNDGVRLGIGIGDLADLNPKAAAAKRIAALKRRIVSLETSR